MASTGRRVQLGRADCLRLLSSVPYGRVVFTSGALPAACLVNAEAAGMAGPSILAGQGSVTGWRGRGPGGIP
ncbi:MAG: hypothetical protein ACRDRJ_18455 [Streptosporangiaceae bacterium]